MRTAALAFDWTGKHALLMFFTRTFAALALALILLPDRAPADSVGAVLDGRAEINVPDGYRRLSPERAVRWFKDLFYIAGRREVLPSEIPDRDPDAISFAMEVAEDSRAHFTVLEYPLTPEGHPIATESAPRLLDDFQETVANGIWCPISSSREAGFFSAARNDPVTGFSHCFGAGGAMAYLVCKKFPAAMVCVGGLDYIEIVKVELSGIPPVATLSDDELITIFGPAGNASVLESVLLSFRYR